MEINKRNRSELKGYFVKNAIPTENNFADFVDAVLVQKDDGIAKLAGTPLSIEATGDDSSQKDVLALYQSFAQQNAAWRMSLNPRSDPNNPQSARSGFGISDAAGRCRFFIDSGSGDIGLGTNTPAARLHVRSDMVVSVLESTKNVALLRLQTSEGASRRVEIINRPGGNMALWVAGGGDSLRVHRSGRVGIGVDPSRALHVGRDGTVHLGGNVGTNSPAGLYWNNNDSYALRRGDGDWKGPNYQQLIMRWITGIVLEPGTGDNAGHGRSYVEIRNGKGLRVSDGATVLGPGGPGNSKFRVALNNSDFAHTRFASSGCGQLEFAGWASGWNINNRTDGKHLYINRDSGSNTDTLIGKAGRELIVKGANGYVGVLGQPSSHLHVHGNLRCSHIRADGGISVGQGDLQNHVEADGSFYRHNGQAYIVVDDNLYIRDMKGGVKFHFDTNLGVLRQDGWTGVTFSHGWRNYDNTYNHAGFFRDRQGVVHLRGLVKSGQVGGDKAIFVLPNGYRPNRRHLFAVCTHPDKIGRVDILPDGRVIAYNVSSGWVSLDGLTFRSV